MHEKLAYHRINEESASSNRLVASEDDFTAGEPLGRSSRGNRVTSCLNLGSHIIAWTLVITLAYSTLRTTTWGTDRFRQHKGFPAQMTYSPAQNSLEYEVKVFKQGIETQEDGVSSDFAGPPSDRLDKAWSDLYNFGMSAISYQEAARLPNKTIPIPHTSDQYIIELDIFHELHCLNRLRKALNPHYFCPRSDPHCDDHRAMGIDYDAREETAPHLAHCIHSLRQSIMCHADVSPVVWHKSLRPGINGEYFSQGYLSVAHTCRNFEKIKQWGLDHQHKGDIDFSILPEDDSIVVPIFN